MVHGSGKVGVSKCNTPKGRTAQDFASGRLATQAKEEPRLRTQIGVSPAIQDDSCNVPARVEAASSEHLAELLTNLFFVVSERGSQQLSAAAVPLFFSCKSRV